MHTPAFLRHYIPVATERCPPRLTSAIVLGQLSFMPTPNLINDRPMGPDMLPLPPATPDLREPARLRGQLSMMSRCVCARDLARVRQLGVLRRGRGVGWQLLTGCTGAYQYDVRQFVRPLPLALPGPQQALIPMPPAGRTLAVEVDGELGSSGERQAGPTWRRYRACCDRRSRLIVVR